MFQPLSSGHHQVTIELNMRKLHTVIHKISLIISKCNEISLSLFYAIISIISIKL